jgi:hypothetical protein
LGGVGGWIYAAVRRRWVLLGVGLLGAGVFVLGAAALGPAMVYPGALAAVHSERRGEHFVLVRRPPATDVIYTIVSASSLDAGRWSVRFVGELDYSEDGSLTADPWLRLSEDEDLLVRAGVPLSDWRPLAASTRCVGRQVLLANRCSSWRRQPWRKLTFLTNLLTVCV